MLHRIVGRGCLLVYRDREGLDAPMCVPEQVQAVFDHGQPVLTDHSLPRARAPVCHHAGMQLHVVNRSETERSNELIGPGDKVIDLTFEYCDPGENEVTLGRVSDRPRTVEVE